ncbi:MAG TPA: sigma-70 family RNA polymerase sigma factor [Myxococcota bacterium]|nr:sigma-70 family RNA polymerase sigma factor [Myxococcota bacterium]
MASATGARAERGGLAERRDDLTLMELVARRDASALDALYLRHASLVFALCLRILRNHAEAEEVLQEVFWELWRSSSRYAAERGSARVYLVQLARSRSLDRVRLRRRREALLADAGGPSVIAAELGGDGRAASGLAAALSSEERSQVFAALRCLSEAERKAVTLSFFDGLSHAEIAAQLGEPLGTVKTRIRRALLRMRVALVSGDGEAS